MSNQETNGKVSPVVWPDPEGKLAEAQRVADAANEVRRAELEKAVELANADRWDWPVSKMGADECKEFGALTLEMRRRIYAATMAHGLCVTNNADVAKYADTANGAKGVIAALRIALDSPNDDIDHEDLIEALLLVERNMAELSSWVRSLSDFAIARQYLEPTDDAEVAS